LTRVLLLETREPEERRAALLEDGTLSLLWVEREDDRTLVGNVYLGSVVRVEPSIGAAFVDLGLDRPGFLPADDAAFREIQEELGAAGPAGPADAPAEQAPREARPPRRIEDLVRTGDRVVVQVARDAVGRKGPTVTTHVSFAGRTLVLMPSLGRLAVSRKIADPEVRREAEDRLRRLGLPQGLGAVARTASVAAAESEMVAEAARLVAAWRAMQDAVPGARAPALLHAEDDFVTRSVRELSVRAPEGSAGPLRIVVDDADAAERARSLTSQIDPAPEVVLHESPAPLFHAFGVERAVRALDDAEVPLPGGASLVIHETEAMWSVDVNSGRLRTGESLEETALATDLLAAREVARQIRLRDLSGLIVVDFIDCREDANRARVEEALRAELARDPAKMRVAPLSEFMVAEITRRRLRSGAARSGSHRCPTCRGRGRIHSARAAGLAALRDVRALLSDGSRRGVEVHAAPAVAAELDRRRPEIDALEARHGGRVVVLRSTSLDGDRFEVRRA
jgi:Rne/Rng family ribonuclease